MKRFVTAGPAQSQGWLLPPSVDEFVPADAPVRVLSRLIDELDIEHLRDAYAGGGRPAYDPVMMVKVLVFGMTQGIRSSRRLEEALLYDLRYKFLAHMATPDYRTIARFRAGSQEILAEVFVRTVKLAQGRGLVRLEHVSVDGTKIAANAGKRQCRSQEELDAGIAKVEKIAGELLAEWRQNDQEEQVWDDQPPKGDPPKRLKTLAKRKKRLEESKDKLEKSGDKSIIVTDEDSRMIKTSGIIRPAYNAQAVVDDACQIIIAAEVTQDEADNALLPPMMEAARDNTGSYPARVSGDGGYWSDAGLEFVEREKLDAYIAPTGVKTAELTGWVYDAETNSYTSPDGLVYEYWKEDNKSGRIYLVFRNQQTKKQKYFRANHLEYRAMQLKTRTDPGKAVYSRRKVIVEPVFGHIKGAYGLTRLLMTGLGSARTEFNLACIAHNLAKIAAQYQNVVRKAAGRGASGASQGRFVRPRSARGTIIAYMPLPKTAFLPTAARAA